MQPRQSLSVAAMYSMLVIFLQTIETIASLALSCLDHIDLSFMQ